MGRKRNRNLSLRSKEAQSVPDPHGTEEEFHTALVKGVLGKLLRKLDAREARVLRLYYGLTPYTEPHTIEEVAEIMGYRSLSHVNMLKTRALFRLRDDPHAEYLAELWEDFA
jgi:DNA-directed RNA polymerase sigma subunit (sigma70/sigma32)